MGDVIEMRRRVIANMTEEELLAGQIQLLDHIVDLTRKSNKLMSEISSQMEVLRLYTEMIEILSEDD